MEATSDSPKDKLRLGAMAMFKHFLGIDFGTTKTILVRKTGSSSPSPVQIDGCTGQIETVFRLNDNATEIEAFGIEAWEEIGLHPNRTFFEFKPYVGTDKLFIFQNDAGDLRKEFYADALSEMFLTELRKRFEGQFLNGAAVSSDDYYTIVGHPAEWEISRIEVLKRVVKSAGFPNVEVACESEGVVGYCRNQQIIDVDIGERILVFDFGGGTLDFAVFSRNNGNLKCIATGGNPDLGGRKFDDLIVNKIISEILSRSVVLTASDLTQIKRYSRKLKEDLSRNVSNGKKSARITIPFLQSTNNSLTDNLNKDDFLQCADGIISQIAQILQDFNHNLGYNIDKIVVAGGSARLFFIPELLERILAVNDIIYPNNPQEVVALGLIELHSSSEPKATVAETEAPEIAKSLPRTEKQPPSTNLKTLKYVLVWILLFVTFLIFYLHLSSPPPQPLPPSPPLPPLVPVSVTFNLPAIFGSGFVALYTNESNEDITICVELINETTHKNEDMIFKLKPKQSMTSGRWFNYLSGEKIIIHKDGYSSKTVVVP